MRYAMAQSAGLEQSMGVGSKGIPTAASQMPTSTPSYAKSILAFIGPRERLACAYLTDHKMQRPYALHLTQPRVLAVAPHDIPIAPRDNAKVIGLICVSAQRQLWVSQG